MKNRTTVERKSERELVVTRTFNGPARIVFEAWTKPELFQNAASGGVRERGERGVESAARILNHTVQYTPPRAGSEALLRPPGSASLGPAASRCLRRWTGA